MHLTLIPYISTAGEIKTKPTQHSVKELRSIGIQPDVLLCRCKDPVPDEQRRKIALFTNVEERAVFSAVDADDLYKIPSLLHEQGLDDIVVDKLRLTVPPADFEKPLDVTAGWGSLLEGPPRRRLETVELLEYLPKQRWFAGKSRNITATGIADWAELNPSHSALALLEVKFEAGPSETYQLPLVFAFGDAADELRRATPTANIGAIVSKQAAGLLQDGVFDDNMCAELLSVIENSRPLPAAHSGRIQGVRGKTYQTVRGPAEAPLQVRRGSIEQSNTSIIYGDRFILKLFRRLEAGINPDCEIGQYLTEKTSFDRIPPFAGMIQYWPAPGAEPTVLAMLQGLVVNEGDGWKWTVEELQRYYESCAPIASREFADGELDEPLELSEHPVSQLARDHVGIYLDSAAILGRRTAELHLALASPTDDPAFAPEPLSLEDLQALFVGARDSAVSVFEFLRKSMSQLPDDVIDIAALVLGQRRRILDHLKELKFDGLSAQKLRIHGDYHLGQVLRVKNDFVLLDFEGEPARSLDSRRSKQCALKDVAGMLRSFSYAAFGTLISYTARHPEDFDSLKPWAQLWERSVAAEFLRAYRDTAQGAQFLPDTTADFRKLLDLFLLDKALYEILYELNNRPAWVRVPMLGIMSLRL